MIVAFEGPAGAGKDYALAQMEGGIKIERPTNLPRNMKPEMGAWTSSVFDYQAIAASVMFPHANVYVNRFLLSRFIYQAIEQGKDTLTREFEANVLKTYTNLLNTACDEADTRLDLVRAQYREQVTINVIIPDLETLVARRKKSSEVTGRRYPFSPQLERSLYLQAVERMQYQKEIQVITYDVY